MRFVESLNQALHLLMAKNKDVYLIGEDLLDPYGGAFKVTKGLSSKYPERVIATPISEASVIGMGIGIAMRGLLPVVEIMFGDFLALGFDQVLNNAAKFKSMYNEQTSVPLTIRSPMGGGRGYGATHSQSLEKFFLGIPGLKVIAPSLYNEIYPLLEYVVCEEKAPKLFVEHKLLYPQEIQIPKDGHLEDFMVDISYVEGYPCVEMSLVPLSECQITVLAYGYAATLVKKVAYDLMMEEEVCCHIIIPTLISPFNYNVLKKSLKVTGSLVVAEEGTMRNGFGAEIASVVQERFYDILRKPVKRVASLDSIIASSKDLESQILISEEKIRDAILEAVQ